MLQAELPKTAEEANELIGAFLLDVGLANEEPEALVKPLFKSLLMLTFNLLAAELLLKTHLTA